MISDQYFKKQVNWNIWGPPVAFIFLLIIEKQALGTFYTSLLYGLVLILTGIIYSIRYRLYHPALLFCLAGLTLWHYVLAAHIETIIALLRWLKFESVELGTADPFSMLTWLINLVIFLAVIPLTIPVFGKAFTLEGNAKKLFRLAALTVPGHDNGFTSRPFAGGAVTFSEDQLKGFAQFMLRQLISIPVFSESGVTLAFSMGRSPLSVNIPSETSYVQFDYTGNISVRIAERDYKRFSRKFTFDLLCGSMESVFRQFLEYYINNKENRILIDLK
jgi:hypothetical protein